MEIQSEANFPFSLFIIVLRKRNRSLKVLWPLSGLFSALFIVLQQRTNRAQPCPCGAFVPVRVVASEVRSLRLRLGFLK